MNYNYLISIRIGSGVKLIGEDAFSTLQFTEASFAHQSNWYYYDKNGNKEYVDLYINSRYELLHRQNPVTSFALYHDLETFE